MRSGARQFHTGNRWRRRWGGNHRRFYWVAVTGTRGHADVIKGNIIPHSSSLLGFEHHLEKPQERTVNDILARASFESLLSTMYVCICRIRNWNYPLINTNARTNTLGFIPFIPTTACKRVKEYTDCRVGCVLEGGLAVVPVVPIIAFLLEHHCYRSLIPTRGFRSLL